MADFKKGRGSKTGTTSMARTPAHACQSDSLQRPGNKENEDWWQTSAWQLALPESVLDAPCIWKAIFLPAAS
jgi:hypothetical protein